MEFDSGPCLNLEYIQNMNTTKLDLLKAKLGEDINFLDFQFFTIGHSFTSRALFSVR
jgi:hypothetical protein